MKPSAVLIAGPTASGKSALAIALAEATGGVVVNADSMQVYSDLAIITARPTDEETARVPHLLYGHVDGDSDYSVGGWLADARVTIGRLWAEDRLPILVGGTGLYFRALTQGLADIPKVPDDVREAIRGEAEPLSPQALHRRLAEGDAETAARLEVADRQRVLRALEVLAATGRPLSEWQKETAPPFLNPATTVRLVLEVPRDLLRTRIDRRFEAMMAEGALVEVARLKARELRADRTILKAHGVPALMRHLAGEMSLADAIAEGQGDTRRYAKRQETFFRHQMAGWPRATPETALDALKDAV